MRPHRQALALALLLAISNVTFAAALDDIKIDVSHDACDGAAASDKSFAVYATNLSATQAIDAHFKYDTIPAQQHFILFDADLNPITDRFPKFHARRLQAHETARVGCTYTFRAAPHAPGPLTVPVAITKQSAAYVNANSAEAPAEDARTFAAFVLQGDISECAAGAKPPGLFYLVNLHPYARLAAAMDLLDEHGKRIGALSPDLSPLGITRLGCSNGAPRPGPIAAATLQVTAGAAAQTPQPLPAPQRREEAQASAPEAPLALGAILTIQNVCAGSAPPGWIKTNDAWNPTVCGKPGTISYNVWVIQRLVQEPIGAVIQACKGAVPSGWTIAGTAWNPTVCGHPPSNLPNVMTIKRMN